MYLLCVTYSLHMLMHYLLHTTSNVHATYSSKVKPSFILTYLSNSFLAMQVPDLPKPLHKQYYYIYLVFLLVNIKSIHYFHFLNMTDLNSHRMSPWSPTLPEPPTSPTVTSPEPAGMISQSTCGSEAPEESRDPTSDTKFVGGILSQVNQNCLN